MSWFGTTSWFLEPISTCRNVGVSIRRDHDRQKLTAVNTRNSSEVMYRRSVASSFIVTGIDEVEGGQGAANSGYERLATLPSAFTCRA